MKARLFVYGTLQNTSIQKEVLGRTTPAIPDILEDFKLSKIQLGNNWYPLAIPSKGNEITGLVLDIDESDFPALDFYESNAYQRKRLKLKSNRMAWVYLKQSSIISKND